MKYRLVIFLNKRLDCFLLRTDILNSGIIPMYTLCYIHLC